MVHLRLNEKEANPNPHINFITALKADAGDEEDARKLLRALAAQVRPVMKAHGFAVNSFEEYEYNKVFAGRNWNNGETVELVLRRPDGSFYPNYWLMSTLCHELAHIKHMNHGSAFQALWSRLRAEVRQLQDKGYYGDGADISQDIGPLDKDCGIPPTFGKTVLNQAIFLNICVVGLNLVQDPPPDGVVIQPGGKRREVVPSLHTGAQTSKKKKSGTRVTSKYAFYGEGVSLGNDGTGTGFGKQAASKRAREERALAAERRLSALQNQTPGISKISEEVSTDGDDSEGEVEFVPETDAERRQAIQEAELGEDKNQKLDSDFSWAQFKDAFNFDGGNSPSGSKQPLSLDFIDISSDDEDTGICDVPVASSSSFMSGSQVKKNSKGKGKAGFGLGNIVQGEIELRKKESLGMAPVKGGGRKLGSKPEPQKPFRESARESAPAAQVDQDTEWSCLACTFENMPGHLSCAVCATPRDEVWRGSAQ